MLWWIANAVFLLVIVPVVVLILWQVLTPIREIRAYADDIAEHGGLFGPHLEATADLERDAIARQGTQPRRPGLLPGARPDSR